MGKCIHVYGCELITSMYMCMCIHVYVYLGSKTYLHGNHKFSPASIKCKCQIKVDKLLKKNLLSHILGFLETNCLPMYFCPACGK